MIHEVSSDLPKLGEREYVQGGTIFNGIVAACDEAFGPQWLPAAEISSFKLEREARANGRILVGDEPLGDLDPHATFAARCDGRSVHGVFLDEGAAFRREPYDEESFYREIEAGDDLNGVFELAGAEPSRDFIKGIVGANKHLHQRTTLFGGSLQKVQFLYLKGLAGACIAQAAEVDRVRITNLTVKEVDSEVWTISRVDVERSGATSSFRICYRALKGA